MTAAADRATRAMWRSPTAASRKSGTICRVLPSGLSTPRGWRSPPALSTSRPTPISPCRSTQRPRARSARGSRPRLSDIVGFSVAPCLPGKVQVLADYLSGGAPWLPFRETSFPDYLDSFPAVAVNAGMLVGHNTLRLMAMGLEDRAPTAAELDQMCALLDQGLSAGALGLSTGLFTPPGSFAEPAEIMALCAVVARHKAAYFTHIRDEANRVLGAVEEAIAVARAYPIHVEIVPLKCSGVDNWGRAAEILDRLAR